MPVKGFNANSLLFDAEMTTNAGDAGDVVLTLLASSLPQPGELDPTTPTFLSVTLTGAGALFPVASADKVYRFQIVRVN